MTVFVTGGSGLVGSHVIEQLTRRGEPVTALVRDSAGETVVRDLGAEAVRGTVEDAAAWRAAEGADAIVHAAAIVTAHEGWERYHAVNVEGTRLAVEAAYRNRARLIHVSSVAIYGRRPERHSGPPISEDAPQTPIAEGDFYARSKRMAEEVLWRASRELGVSAAAVRPCVIYGERERHFMSRMMRVLRLGIVPLVGRGDNRLAMVYAGNVADAVLRAIDRADVTGPFNTTNDGGITQRRFYEILAAALGRRLRFIRIPYACAAAGGLAAATLVRITRPGRYVGVGASGAAFLAKDNPFTSERAVHDLGWQPATPAEAALERTARWFAEHELP